MMKYMSPWPLFRELRQTNHLAQGPRLLGLDVGDKYVGLAISDPNNTVASPLSVLVRTKTNEDLMATDFQTLMSEPTDVEESADQFVVRGEIFEMPRASWFSLKWHEISELSLAGFIVGYPCDSRRRNHHEAYSVKLFVDDMCKTGKLDNLHYTYWDECFTSKNVISLLRPLDLHPVQTKSILDKFAAVGILQGYLDYINKKLKMEPL